MFLCCHAVHKLDNKKNGGVSINNEVAGVIKYKEMLLARVKDELKILGYGSHGKIEPEILYSTESEQTCRQ